MSTKQLPEGWRWEGDSINPPSDYDTEHLCMVDDELRVQHSRGVLFIPAAVLRALLDSTPPHDESKPPPGFRWKDDREHWRRQGVVCRITPPILTLAEAWRIYDAEHGYASTEAPRSEPTDQGRARIIAALRELQSELVLPDARDFMDIVIARVECVGHEGEPQP